MSNPFITDKCDAQATEALVAAGLPIMEADGKVHWAAVEEGAGTNVGYGRGWLVVRWAYLDKFQPNLLVDSTKLVSDAFKQATKDGTSGTFDEKTVLQAKVIELRDVENLSWGEIAVRMQIPESRVRAAYRHNGIRKDLGLRIGKGGRFAYDAGELYTDNRRKEGAQIPLDLKAKPTVEQLLNYVPKEGTTTSQQKGQVISRIVKIRALMNDKATPDAQRVNIQQQVRDLMEKHSIREQDIAAWVKARDAKKGRRAA